MAAQDRRINEGRLVIAVGLGPRCRRRTRFIGPMLARLFAGPGFALLLAGPGFALLLATGSTQAQTPGWPSKTVRIVTTSAPGAPTDIVARALSDRLAVTLRHPVVVENKPGAGGNIGAADVARAVPDGHTWLVTTDTTLTVNPLLYRNPGFKVDSLQPVTYAARFNQMLVCHPGAGIDSVKALVAKAGSDRGFTYASGGAGVPGHLAMELLLTQAAVPMTHVPYKGPAPAMTDVIAGQVACGFLAGPTVVPQVRAGRLIALGVSGSKRSPMAPDVPTIAETGFGDYDATFSVVVFAPRGVPEPVLDAFRKAVVDTLRNDEVVGRLATADLEAVGGTGAEAARQLAADSRKWGEVMKRVGLKLD
jgi:tripartite-type tricarboxylate transporter receptor subunit TctC